MKRKDRTLCSCCLGSLRPITLQLWDPSNPSVICAAQAHLIPSKHSSFRRAAPLRFGPIPHKHGHSAIFPPNCYCEITSNAGGWKWGLQKQCLVNLMSFLIPDTNVLFASIWTLERREGWGDGTLDEASSRASLR